MAKRTCDQLGLDPDGAAAGFGGDACEGAGGLLERLEFVVEELVSLLREAGAGAAGVDEPSAIVIAEQQGADALHAGVAGAGEGVSADDEFLFVKALAFDPIGAAPGGVLRGGALGDDALGAQLAGVVEDGGTVGLEVLGEAEDVRVGVGEDFGEQGFAFA